LRDLRDELYDGASLGLFSLLAYLQSLFVDLLEESPELSVGIFVFPLGVWVSAETSEERSFFFDD